MIKASLLENFESFSAIEPATRVTNGFNEKLKEIKKIDEKIEEVNEQMRRDRIDTTSKLTVVKSEFEQKTFDTDTFNFLKN